MDGGEVESVLGEVGPNIMSIPSPWVNPLTVQLPTQAGALDVLRKDTGAQFHTADGDKVSVQPPRGGIHVERRAVGVPVHPGPFEIEVKPFAPCVEVSLDKGCWIAIREGHPKGITFARERPQEAPLDGFRLFLRPHQATGRAGPGPTPLPLSMPPGTSGRVLNPKMEIL